jgi:hypothetical protein
MFAILNVIFVSIINILELLIIVTDAYVATPQKMFPLQHFPKFRLSSSKTVNTTQCLVKYNFNNSIYKGITVNIFF